MVFEYLNAVNLSVNQLMERIGVGKFGVSVVKVVLIDDWIVIINSPTAATKSGQCVRKGCGRRVWVRGGRSLALKFKGH